MSPLRQRGTMSNGPDWERNSRLLWNNALMNFSRIPCCLAFVIVVAASDGFSRAAFLTASFIA
jgi:hypothetical protein